MVEVIVIDDEGNNVLDANIEVTKLVRIKASKNGYLTVKIDDLVYDEDKGLSVVVNLVKDGLT